MPVCVMAMVTSTVTSNGIMAYLFTRMFFNIITYSVFRGVSSGNVREPRNATRKATIESTNYFCIGKPDQKLDKPCITQYYVCDGGCGTEGRTLGDMLNVAFNKPAFMSSRHFCAQETYCNLLSPPACAAVNGRLDRELSNGFRGKPWNCIHTGYADLAAWWFVNLNKPYTITYVWIKERFAGENWNLRWQRMMGIKVHVDAVVCYSFPDYYDWTAQGNWNLRFQSLNDILFEARCREPLTGTFIRLQKDVTDISNTNRFITLCEVQTFVCPRGTYSENWEFTKEGLAGTIPTCRQCPIDCKYPCDNIYGCLDSFPGRPFNLLIHKPVIVLSELSVLPAKNAVDGVAFPRDRFCYHSFINTDIQFQHFLRVSLDVLHVVYSSKVTGVYNGEYYLKDLEVRVARAVFRYREGPQKGDTLCWKMHGSFPTSGSHNDSCSGCPHNCPRGLFLTFFPDSRLTYFRLCEVEALGYPLQEQPAPGDRCDCMLSVCLSPMVCQNRTCKSVLGGACSGDSHCEGTGQHVCERGQCKIAFNQECGGNDPNRGKPRESYCAQGLKCSKTNSRCMKDISSNCNTDADCAYQHDPNGLGVFCDAVDQCKLALTAYCENTRVCGAGAVCENQKCVCSEGSARYPPGGNVCVSNVSGVACEQNSECNTENYECLNKTCRCKFGYALYNSDYSCRLKVDSVCNTDANCGEGLVCQANSIDSSIKKCLIRTGFPCDPKAPTEVCEVGNQCEHLGGRCKIALEKPCNQTEDCVSKTVCDESRKCKVLGGHNCTLNYSISLNPCEGGYVCDQSQQDSNLRCRLKVGEQCNLPDRNILCERRAVCDTLDTDARECRLDLYASCSMGGKSLCRMNTVCSYEHGLLCLHDLGQKCHNDSTCARGFCDEDGRCRLAKGSDCKANTAFCRLRSYCSTQTFRCSCVPEVTDVKSDDCALKVADGDAKDPQMQFLGSPCDLTANQSCLGDRNARCGDYGKCACMEGFAPSITLTCYADAGSPCEMKGESTTGEEDTPCVDGTICQNHRCMILVGKPCKKNEDFCISGSVCDEDMKCKLNLGRRCQHDIDNCKTGTVCDVLNTCKIPRNASGCFSRRSCIAAADCIKPENYNDSICACDTALAVRHPDNPLLCLPRENKVGGHCPTGICEDKKATCHADRCTCITGYVAQDIDLSCKKALDTACGADEECVVGTRCDPVAGVCKSKVGEGCNPLTSRPCASGAVCDEDSICRMDIGESCYVYNSEVPCTLNSVCDVLGVCKRVLGYFCKPPSETQGKEVCVAGARCTQGKCQCNRDVTDRNTEFCAPKAGKVGGKCLVGAICKVPGSFCNKDVDRCQCLDVKDIRSSDLSCGMGTGESTELDDNGWLITGLTLGICLFIVAVVLFAVRKRQQISKRNKMMQVMTARRSTITHMQEEVAEFLCPLHDRTVSSIVLPGSLLETDVDSAAVTAVSGDEFITPTGP